MGRQPRGRARYRRYTPPCADGASARRVADDGRLHGRRRRRQQEGAAGQAHLEAAVGRAHHPAGRVRDRRRRPQRFSVQKRKEFVADACRYWTLKREARRGAALLKRLQLQMETFSSMELTRRNFAAMGPSGKTRLQRRIDFADALLKDLEQLKSLSEDLVQRELVKLEAAELVHDFVDTCYFPVAKLFVPVVEKAIGYGEQTFFPHLVSSHLAVLLIVALSLDKDVFKRGPGGLAE